MKSKVLTRHTVASTKLSVMARTCNRNDDDVLFRCFENPINAITLPTKPNTATVRHKMILAISKSIIVVYFRLWSIMIYITNKVYLLFIVSSSFFLYILAYIVSHFEKCHRNQVKHPSFRDIIIETYAFKYNHISNLSCSQVCLRIDKIHLRVWYYLIVHYSNFFVDVLL